MNKTSIADLTADWSIIGNRAPWLHVTSMELSKVLDVHLQTINNWRIRGKLPEPSARSRKLRGNKNYFRIGAIREWLESRSEKDIIREWVWDDMRNPTIPDGEIRFLLEHLYKTDPSQI